MKKLREVTKNIKNKVVNHLTKKKGGFAITMEGLGLLMVIGIIIAAAVKVDWTVEVIQVLINSVKAVISKVTLLFN